MAGLSRKQMNTKAEKCRQYLELLNTATGGGVGKFYLCLGQDFELAPLALQQKRGPRKQCYANAGRLFLESTDLYYAEGYACLPGLFPMHHAWCLDSTGRVIDNTWDYQPTAEYFGLVLNRKFVHKRIEETQTWGVLAEHVSPELLSEDFVKFLEPRWMPSPEKQSEFANWIAALNLKGHPPKWRVGGRLLF